VKLVEGKLLLGFKFGLSQSREPVVAWMASVGSPELGPALFAVVDFVL
jgi:hypothetical protein